MEPQDIFVIVGKILFAIFGACAKWLSVKDRKPQRTLRTEAVIAAFAGGLVFCIYSWLQLNIYSTFALSGLAGWLGANGIDWLGKVIIRHSGVAGQEHKNDKEG